MTATFLDTILEAKRGELAGHKRKTPLAALEERICAFPGPANFSGALLGESVRLIAEVKKASPSQGLLCPNFDPVRLATIYAENGAAAVSVLTEANHFQGSLEHLHAVKEAMRPHGLPVLRKDFMFDPYQLYESRAHGADAALLIVAMLSPGQVCELLDVARSIWLQCLVEVHNETELAVALEAGADVVGINNRDLHTFHTDPSVTDRLRQHIPPGKIIVAESGIKSRQDVMHFHRLGVHAVLVGEALVTASDPGANVRKLLGVQR